MTAIIPRIARRVPFITLHLGVSAQNNLMFTRNFKDAVEHNQNVAAFLELLNDVNDDVDFQRLPAAVAMPPPRPALRRQNAFGPQVTGLRRSLPIYSSLSEARPAHWECPVCLEGPEKEVVMFPCGRHDFHRHCLVRLWQEDYRCPICRQVNNNKSL